MSDETVTDGSSTPDRGIWPGLSYADALGAREWLRRLGFEDGVLVTAPDDPTRVVHSEMRWREGGRVMLHSSGGGGADLPDAVGTGNLYVVVEDADAVHATAVGLGVEMVRDLEDSDYGSRGFTVRDPEGNAWSFGTYAGS